MRARQWPMAAGACLVAGLQALPFLQGRTLFWGDLTYIHFPWRALVAQDAQRGMLPLWNPFCYLGMPLAAQMQSAAWYPGSLPFYLFSFAPALALYHAGHVLLAELLAFLWLRRLGFGRAPAAGGALLYALGGWTISRLVFLNHLSSLAFFPAILLFADHPLLAGAAIALSFFSGYPPMLAGQLAAAFLATAAADLLRSPRAWKRALALRARRWAAAWCVGAALSACLLFPAARLVRDSRRARGMEPAEVLTWSYSVPDLGQFAGPALVGSREFSPSVNWWKTSYAGVAGLAAAGVGLASLAPAAAAASAAGLGAVVFLILGANLPASAWVWNHFAPLRFVRYPGNMAYLAAPLLAFLASAGLRRLVPALTVAAAGLASIYLELQLYALRQPTVSAGYYTDAGPLVRKLQAELGGHRYLPSPLALHAGEGQGRDFEAASLDFKHRLYGLTNAPYRLSSAANFGEPLVPARTYAFMDFLFRRPSLAAAAPWLAWADVGAVLTRDRLADPPGLSYAGQTLWHLYRVAGARRAALLPEPAGARLGDAIEGPPPRGESLPAEYSRSRDDRFSVSGSGEGWLFVAEPWSRDWEAWSGGRRIPTEPALGAFQKVRVGPGPWKVRFRYDPPAWRAGLWVTIAALLALCARGLGSAGELARR